MFIRSQDKEKFGEYREVFVVQASVMGTVATKDVTKLGDYKTYEVALAIVDKIQHQLLRNIKQFGNPHIIINMPENEDGLYE